MGSCYLAELPHSIRKLSLLFYPQAWNILAQFWLVDPSLPLSPKDFHFPIKNCLEGIFRQQELQLPTQFLSLQKKQSHRNAVTGTVLFRFMSPSCSALLPFQTIYLSSCRRLTAAGSRVESAARGSLPPSKYLPGKSEPADKYQGHWITGKNTRKFAEHWREGEGKD